MTLHFSWLLQTFTFSDRREQSRPGVNVFMPWNPSQGHIWSTLNIPCRGLLVLLCNKCPLSLFKMCPAANITYRDLSRCLQASVPTNSLCSPVPVQVNTDSEHKKKTAREKKKDVHSTAHFVLSRLPLKKVVFRVSFHPSPWSVLRAALSFGCFAYKQQITAFSVKTIFKSEGTPVCCCLLSGHLSNSYS